mmetsp:Transcript_38310/g.109370  ORF Transcript_38310/g.109370 Transcript_38310/m.109370 type:complete len:207 (+) Transcript_38310:546-1166(+)
MGVAPLHLSSYVSRCWHSLASAPPPPPASTSCRRSWSQTARPWMCTCGRRPGVRRSCFSKRASRRRIGPAAEASRTGGASSSSWWTGAATHRRTPGPGTSRATPPPMAGSPWPCGALRRPRGVCSWALSRSSPTRARTCTCCPWRSRMLSKELCRSPSQSGLAWLLGACRERSPQSLSARTIHRREPLRWRTVVISSPRRPWVATW